ncbi:MAG: proteasome assembly chaperone family protein [Candidatus Bathycorpusculaceae bacterium]
MSEVKIIEKKEIPSGAVMLFGFPDVGLVGVIAASHLISEIENMEEVAYMDSKLLPPLIVLHEGLPHSPIRIFGNRNILLAVSETAIPADVIYPIMDTLIDWGKNKNVKMMISLSGIPIQDRQDLKELKVFAAASSPEMLKMLQEKEIEILQEGYMVGPQAIMLQRCATMGLPAITLLAQCFLNYPDPEAAAEVLKGLANITEIKVDVSKLLEKGEEIRLRARDVMRRTQQEMSKMKKTQEYDIPLYIS